MQTGKAAGWGGGGGGGGGVGGTHNSPSVADSMTCEVNNRHLICLGPDALYPEGKADAINDRKQVYHCPMLQQHCALC